MQIVAECYTSTTVIIATVLGFFSRMCSLQSLEMLESEQQLVTALSLESWPGVLQMVQKHIRGLQIGLETEMGFPVSEAYSLPTNANSLVGSVVANLCGSHYTLQMAMVEASSQRVLIEKAFSIPKCVRLTRMSHHSHKLLRKILGSVPEDQRDNLSEVLEEELLSLENENSSDFERQNTIEKAMNSAPAMEENDVTHEKMIEFEPLLEASGERNLRIINLTHGDCPCHCLAQTVWYPVTSWLYTVMKDHMKKRQKDYRQFLVEIGPEAFKRPLLTLRNAITTGWKRVGRVSRDNTRVRELILEEDLAKNMSLRLHNSFCRNRESKLKGLPNQAKRLQEQREWTRVYEQLKAWEDIVIGSDDEEELARQITVSSASGLSTSKTRGTN